MKLLTPAQIVELATASDATISRAAQKLAPLVGSSCDDETILRDIKSGRLQSREVLDNGKPAYVFFYGLDARNFLVINATAFVGDGEPNLPLWIAAADRLAAEMKCDGITFVTRRRGLVAVATETAGFAIDGIILSKKCA